MPDEQQVPSETDIKEAMMALGIDLDAPDDEVVEDLDSILLGENKEIVWNIGTGLSTDAGAARKFKVVALDPLDSTLLAKFAEKLQSIGHDSAIKFLWDSVVIQPPKLSDKYGRLPNAFKEGLTERIMRLVGFENFIEKLAENKALLRQTLASSSTRSLPATAAPLPKSEDGLKTTLPGVTSWRETTESSPALN